MFRALLCPSSGGQLYYTASGIITLSSPTECDDITCCIIQFDLLMMSTEVLETCRVI